MWKIVAGALALGVSVVLGHYLDRWAKYDDDASAKPPRSHPEHAPPVAVNTRTWGTCRCCGHVLAEHEVSVSYDALYVRCDGCDARYMSGFGD